MSGLICFTHNVHRGCDFIFDEARDKVSRTVVHQYRKKGDLLSKCIHLNQPEGSGAVFRDIRWLLENVAIEPRDEEREGFGIVFE